MVPVLWPLLMTSKLIQSGILIEDGACFVEKTLYLFNDRSFY